MLLEAIAKREDELERRAIKRAGLIAATIMNYSPLRRRGAPAAKPDDFVSGPKGPPLGSPEWTAAFRERIKAHNARVQ